jgi:hypothetical protein
MLSKIKQKTENLNRIFSGASDKKQQLFDHLISSIQYELDAKNSEIPF